MQNSSQCQEVCDYKFLKGKYICHIMCRIAHNARKFAIINSMNYFQLWCYIQFSLQLNSIFHTDHTWHWTKIQWPATHSYSGQTLHFMPTGQCPVLHYCIMRNHWEYWEYNSPNVMHLSGQTDHCDERSWSPTDQMTIPVISLTDIFWGRALPIRKCSAVNR